ncbi:MAG TPA: acyl-CoA dehydrogenase family protein, partial [Thermoanaerobaculia bacterium]|nr:acyl-CoA dehydrogenase family protein [Thermoanaerobaculia bacterium]
MKLKDLLPRMSETEREALEAGTVWIEGGLFSGRPDFRRVLAEPYPVLTGRERAFLDGPVEEVCRMVDPWELSRRRELPPEVWDFLKRERFFGLTIPEEYGGYAFSALACSTIFGKLASRSLPLSAVVLIPNSVGPAELLLAYGTDEQRRHYLPRLARGEEIPCFALTEPEAGSDAASLTSEGVVFRGRDGRISLRLNWRKRYITLAPVATLLGLAVRLRDPENLLGQGEDVGITCVLVPTSTPGVEIGRRHDPLGIPFPNGPTEGRGVVVPLDAIPGGAAGAGKGWRMLMEALSAGRSISLPAQSAGGAKLTARVVGAYAA